VINSDLEPVSCICGAESPGIGVKFCGRGVESRGSGAESPGTGVEFCGKGVESSGSVAESSDTGVLRQWGTGRGLLCFSSVEAVCHVVICRRVA